MLIDNLPNHQLALIYAHRLFGMPWRERVLKGWQLVRFRNQLGHGVFRFRYIKTDATIRVAYGTLKWDLIPLENRPVTASNRNAGFSTIAYFDLVRNEWRSFKITMLIFESIRHCHPVWVADED